MLISEILHKKIEESLLKVSEQLEIPVENPIKFVIEKPKNIVVLNAECGNVIIELYPEISPNGVERFKKLINLKAYDNVAFHRVIKDKLVQAGDLEFGKKNQLDYGKIGTGKSGFGTIKSEIDAEFNFERGSVGLARTLKYDTEAVSYTHLTLPTNREV